MRRLRLWIPVGLVVVAVVAVAVLQLRRGDEAPAGLHGAREVAARGGDPDAREVAERLADAADLLLAEGKACEAQQPEAPRCLRTLAAAAWAQTAAFAVVRCPVADAVATSTELVGYLDLVERQNRAGGAEMPQPPRQPSCGGGR